MRGGAETFNKLQKFLQLRSKSDNKLHIEKNRKTGNQIKTGDKEYKLSDLDTRNREIIDEMIIIENNDLEDMVFKIELTYHENAEILDTKFIDAKSTEYTIPP